VGRGLSLTRCPAPMPGPLRGWLADPSSLLDRLDFTGAGGLQQSEACARGFLRVQVALSFVLDLQARPFIRIDSLEVGSFELAIGGGLRREQRRVRPPDFWFGISNGFGGSTGAYGSPKGRCLAFVQHRADFALRRIARAAGKRHRTQDDADGQKFWRERFQAGAMRPRACLFARILKTKRSARDRHANDFRLVAATMNGKFESTSNNYDESNLNRPHSAPPTRDP
jgi:hypothetical protein